MCDQHMQPHPPRPFSQQLKAPPQISRQSCWLVGLQAYWQCVNHAWEGKKEWDSSVWTGNQVFYQLTRFSRLSASDMATAVMPAMKVKSIVIEKRILAMLALVNKNIGENNEWRLFVRMRDEGSDFKKCQGMDLIGIYTKSRSNAIGGLTRE